MIKAIIYTKPDCQGCRITKRRFIKLGIPVEERQIADYPKVREALKEMNWFMMPYVQVVEGDKTLDHWHGLKPDKINHWGNGDA